MAEPAAFEFQECKFLGTVQDAQVAVELEAVDHRRRIVCQDVLRPQVAVCFDDAATLGPRVDPVAAGVEKSELRVA